MRNVMPFFSLSCILRLLQELGEGNCMRPV
jgi:hypothetical protein